ncbi:MAG: DUF3071 domain-containing protein [Actinobacteria bacterium]|nr:DUF3071 domain-containing protein [Actinomycetota bacterium]
MPRVYLVGVTEDRSGIVLGKSRRSKKGESVLEIDHEVLDAIAEIRRYRAEGSGRPSVSSPALPSRRSTAGEVSSPSALSPREIQARLRRGDSIQSVARRAGVEEWRIEVYAAPIAAEQARVVSRARELVMEKRSAGPSGRTLGESVQGSVVEKRVPMDVDSFEAAWSAAEPDPDRWVVRFQYVSRGHTQTAEWRSDPENGTVTATNRLASMIGWRDPRRTGKTPALPDAGAPSTRRPATRRARPSGKKAAVKPPSARASAKKAPARAASKRASAKKAPTKKPVGKKPAAKKAPAKKAPAKKPAGKKPAGKKPAAKKAPAKKPPGKKATTGGTRGGSSRSQPARGRHLRIVEAPPDVVETVPTAAQAQAREPWREQLVRRRTEDISAPYARRHWREEVGRAGADDSALEAPDWVGSSSRPAEPVTPPPARAADAAEAIPAIRRSPRRRQRPLRAR